MSTNKFSPKYEELVFSNVSFKKESNTLTIKINNESKNDILKIVEELNDGDINFEKRDDHLVIPIIKKQNVTPIVEPPKKDMTISRDSKTMIKITEELVNLDDKYKKFVSINFDNTTKKISISIRDNKNNGNKIYIFYTIKDNIKYVGIIQENNDYDIIQSIQIPYDKPEDIDPEFLYGIVYLMRIYKLLVTGNTITIDRIYYGKDKILSIVYEKNNSWKLKATIGYYTLNTPSLLHNF